MLVNLSTSNQISWVYTSATDLMLGQFHMLKLWVGTMVVRTSVWSLSLVFLAHMNLKGQLKTALASRLTSQ